MEELRVSLALAVGVSALLAGCLGGYHPGEPQEKGSEDIQKQSESPPPGLPLGAVAPQPPTAPPDTPRSPRVVVAHIDVGINPYHGAFRDDGPLGRVHPCKYIEGFPCEAPPLELTLDAASWEEAFAADKATWESVVEGTLYWVPGTKIVGAIAFGPGGTNCPAVAIPPASYLDGDCPDALILDDHGHGTMTASRAAGGKHSLAPDARFVSISGDAVEGVRWAAEQGWIDVQTNSWGSLLPHPAGGVIGDEVASTIRDAASRMVTVFASGNGILFSGVAPTPTYLEETMPPGVIMAGASDNGRATLWHGSPPHVVADGYQPVTALHHSLTEYAPSPYSCCTSASAPYVAGGAASVILEARRILGDAGSGIREGVVASGEAGLVPEGPLADGTFTLDELRQVFFSTAQARPRETEDDGLAHWLSGPRAPDYTEYGPGGNAYCQGCWTAPIPYDALPAELPLVALVGYGGIDIHSDALAKQVLQGLAPLPDRQVEDRFFEVDGQVRSTLFD